MDALDFYYAPTPNGWKVTIMLEELREAGASLPETHAHLVNLAEGDQFKPDFTAINPNQKIPALRHGAKVFMESCAILQYLGETFPTDLFPQDDRRWDVIQWLYWQAANLGPAFGNKLSYTRYINIPDAAKAHPLERFERESDRLVAVMGRQFTRHAFLAGDEFSIADIAALPWVRAYKWAKVDITKCPRVADWLERCMARPGVQRGVSYGVPQDEVNSFSQKRREAYMRRGAVIADNTNIHPLEDLKSSATDREDHQ